MVKPKGTSYGKAWISELWQSLEVRVMAKPGGREVRVMVKPGGVSYGKAGGV